jgi:hypothetical protein
MKLVLSDDEGNVIDMWDGLEDSDVFFDLANTSIACATADTITEFLVASDLF